MDIEVEFRLRISPSIHLETVRKNLLRMVNQGSVPSNIFDVNNDQYNK